MTRRTGSSTGRGSVFQVVIRSMSSRYRQSSISTAGDAPQMSRTLPVPIGFTPNVSSQSTS